MLKRLVNAIASWKADRDVRHGLMLVRDDWQAFKNQHALPAEEFIVEYVGPFIAPMVGRLSSDSVWGERPLSVKLDLIFVVLLAEMKTGLGQTKLHAMRELLGQQK